MGKLFSGNEVFFNIPRFQRRYVWTKKNWEQLFEDIEYVIK